MAEKKKYYYGMDLWFSQCLRASDPSKLEWNFILYIKEKTIFKNIMNFKSYYEIDQKWLGNGKRSKARLVMKTLLEKNQIIFEDNKISINFNARTWNLSNKQSVKINEILLRYDK